MTGLVVVGAQWGDEGKGKFVDWLSARAEVVVRFQGGHNAGHTLVIDGEEYRLSMLPSGVLRPGVVSAIGSGTVIDPWALAGEIDSLRERGVEIGPDRLRVAETAALILPMHRDLDELREARAGSGRIGTTGRGIGPAYEDRVGRRALRMLDLIDDHSIDEGLDRLLAHHQPLRAGLEADPVDVGGLRRALREVGDLLAPYVAPVWREAAVWVGEGRRILYEGAQGAMLDIDFGTYPFVTSSSTLAGQAAIGVGVGPSAIGGALGIAKAYATRVGAGPFPTELTDATGGLLGERGAEFGTVTGRRRRCGWLDLALLRQAVQVSSLSGLALSKIDVLDGFDELRLCLGYRLDGQTLDRLPANAQAQRLVEPVYETLQGWDAPTRGVRTWGDLPEAARQYVQRIETVVGCPVALLSTSPEREDTIVRADRLPKGFPEGFV